MADVASAIAGAGATALVGAAGSYLSYARGRKRLLEVAALQCLDRLYKLEDAFDGELASASEWSRLPLRKRRALENELYLLGGELDRYLTAIAEAWPRQRRTHLPLHTRARRILIRHTLEEVPGLAHSLEDVVLHRSWLARAERRSRPGKEIEANSRREDRA